MQFSYREYVLGTDKMLAICDAEILGKTFEEKDLCIEVSEEFYSGGSCSDNAAIKLIQSATIVNAVGANIISVMLKNKIIDKEGILCIQNIPHAQTVSMG